LAFNSIKELPRRTNIKASVAVLTLLLFLHGGGVFTFILRSDSTWYWPNPAVQKINQTTQKILSPITIEGSKYY
jgi:hypothetical protein